MLFTYGSFSREAAQDRSPWVERSGTLGETPRGANPARGAGKQPLDSDGGSIRPVQEIQRRGQAKPLKSTKLELINRPCTMHQPLAQALSLARRRCCRRPAFPAAPKPAPGKHPHPPASQQRAPRLPRNTPNHHATARLVAHFNRKTAARKVTHITNKIIKRLILILLMERPKAPKRGKSPKPCHIRTYSVKIQPKS